jgi:dolichol-phosphate mannosyltransferase
MMTKARDLLVVLPTYNEIDSIAPLVDEIVRTLPEADILVIDDSSPDGTGDWCDRRAAEDPRLRCIHREGKLGLGSALVAGMQYAIRQGYRCVVTMDADFSHPPGALPELIAALGPANAPAVDVAIGSRYVPGGAIEGWPLVRHLMSRAINLYARWLLWLSPRDCSSGLRCYWVECLAALDFAAIRSHGYAFEEEILARLKRAGARFREVPICFVNRRRGASKINLREAMAAVWHLFRVALEGLSLWRRGHVEAGSGRC